MKILAVASVLFIIKGTQGGVIPQDESKSNKSVHTQQSIDYLLKQGTDITRAVSDILSQTEMSKFAKSNLEGVTTFLKILVEYSSVELFPWLTNIKWKGEDAYFLLLEQASLIYDRMEQATKELYEAVDNETISSIHEELEQLSESLNVNRENLINGLDSIYEGATHRVEEIYNITTPTSGNFTQFTQGMKEYFTSVVDVVNEGMIKFLKSQRLKKKA
ncbi:uncharacterized protein LOC122540630 [Chiloscyllium plagiosum]|uniref:uncharacterized protein LOC122540630 n=1 Tax=Chiloscyllium plagiosum TaxID=36176 RepID=UPI001CB85064|nr:uncharacterized protein LOC122540630 [Chiloscyllium plagiosum]